MIKDFAEIMSLRTDKQLAEILTTKRSEYQTEAIEAAEHEFKKRELVISTLITENEIKIAEALKAPIDPAKEDLHWYFKICTLGLPSLFWVICEKIFVDSPPLIYSFVPISITAQIMIHSLLQQKGFTKIAKDFEFWSYYSWIIRLLLYILGLLLARLAFI